jgi:hypothetical protein
MIFNNDANNYDTNEIIYLFQVPLGMLFKNENITDDMIEILQTIHSKYVPTKDIIDEEGEVKPEVIESLFFGGDQLTEERARNSKDARNDGDTSYESLTV